MANIISDETIEYVGILAKLELSPEEKEQAKKDIDVYKRQEYQDSNLVQEAILESISRSRLGRENRFMVGDVKQSIYRFRQAEPGLFLEKYVHYGEKDGGIRVDLHQNFRSRSTVPVSYTHLVGRLIQQKEIRPALEKLGQYQTGFFTAGQGRDFFGSCFSGEKEGS